MSSILAIIADGGRASAVIYTEGEDIHYVLFYFIDFDKTFQRQPHPTPCKEAPGGGVCSSMEINRGVPPFYADRHFDELSRGFVSYLLNASFKKRFHNATT